MVEHLARAVVITLVFGVWTLCYSIVALVYIFNTLSKRDQFYLRVRMPSVLVLEIIQLTVMTTGSSLREIFAVWGGHFPCALQDLSFVIGTAGYVVVWPIRMVQLIFIFDPDLRKLYFKFFRTFKFFLLFLLVAFVIAVYVAMVTGRLKGCVHECGQPNCFWGSRWIALFVYMVMLYPILSPLIYKMYKLKIQDRVGIVKDIKHTVVYCTATNMIWTVIVPLVDYGILSPWPWYTIGSLSFVFSTTQALFIGHIWPAKRYNMQPKLGWKVLPSVASESKDDIGLTVLVREARQRRRERSTMLSTTGVTTIQDLTVMDVLNCTTTRHMFLTTCRQHLCEEPALFLLAIRDLGDLKKTGLKDSNVRTKLYTIYVDYVKPGGIYELPLTAKTRRHLLNAFMSLRNKDEDEATKRRKKKKTSKWSLPFSKRASMSLSTLAPLPEEEEATTFVEPEQGQAEQFWARLYAASEEMQQLLTSKVMPTFRQNEDFLVLGATVLLEFQQGPQSDLLTQPPMPLEEVMEELDHLAEHIEHEASSPLVWREMILYGRDDERQKESPSSTSSSSSPRHQHYQQMRLGRASIVLSSLLISSHCQGKETSTGGSTTTTIVHRNLRRATPPTSSPHHALAPLVLNDHTTATTTTTSSEPPQACCMREEEGAHDHRQLVDAEADLVSAVAGVLTDDMVEDIDRSREEEEEGDGRRRRGSDDGRERRRDDDEERRRPSKETSSSGPKQGSMVNPYTERIGV